MAMGSTPYNEKCIVPAHYPQTCWENHSWLRVNNAAQRNVRKCHHSSLLIPWSHGGELRKFVLVLTFTLLNSCQAIYACSNRHTHRCANKISYWDPQQAQKPWNNHCVLQNSACCWVVYIKRIRKAYMPLLPHRNLPLNFLTAL